MRSVWITGERGSTATAFENYIKNYKIENSINNVEYDYWRETSPSREIDIFDPTLETLLERSEPEYFIHTADLYDPMRPHNMIRYNIEGSYYVFNACRNLKETKCIYISHSHEFELNSYYDFSKKASEHLLFLENPLNHLIVHPPYLYGNDAGGGVINSLVRSIKNPGHTAHIEMNLENPFPFMHVKDFVLGLEFIMDEWDTIKASTNYITISPLEHRTLSDVIDTLEGLEKHFDYEIEEKDLFPTQLVDCSTNHLSFYGWKESLTLEEGLELFVQNG